MNILSLEFKMNLKSLLIWSTSLVFIYVVASIEFSAFAGDPAIQEAMAEFDILFQALGSEVADMTTPEGFLSILSIYIYLPLALYSGILGASIISKEEKNKTVEFLFALPVSRNRVLKNKLYVAIINTILINLIVVVSNILIYSRFDVDTSFYIFVLNMGVGVLVTQLIFLSIGLVLASFLKRYKLSGSITIAVLISTYMLSMLIGFVEELEVIEFLTPFKYFTAVDMMNGDYNLWFSLLSIVIIASGITGLFHFYNKRDLYI